MQVVHYPDHRNLTVLPNYLNEVYKVTNETNQRKIQSNKRSFLVAVFVAVVLLIFPWLLFGWYVNWLDNVDNWLRNIASCLLRSKICSGK